MSCICGHATSQHKDGDRLVSGGNLRLHHVLP
jgi:hypothetical protein